MVTGFKARFFRYCFSQFPGRGPSLPRGGARSFLSAFCLRPSGRGGADIETGPAAGLHARAWLRRHGAELLRNG